MSYKYSIKIQHKKLMYCPVIKAEMSVISQEISELDLFSKILIWAVGRNYSLEQISEITNLSMVIMEDEVGYLKKIGLLEERNHVLMLTGLGFSYYQKIQAVEEFNDRKIQVFINSVSGEVLKEDLELEGIDQIPSPDLILRQRIIPELYGNLNPSNSKDFLLDHYELAPLSSEEKSLLDVSLKLRLDKEKKQFLKYDLCYVPFIIHDDILNDMNHHHLVSRTEGTIFEETHSSIPFMYPFQKGKLKIENVLLHSYRNVISTLEKVNQFEQGLLSEKSKHLLQMYEFEKDLQSQLTMDIFFESVSGVLTTSLNPEFRIEKNVRNEVVLQPNYDLNKILKADIATIIKNLTGVELEGDFWHLSFQCQDEAFLKVQDHPTNTFSERAG